MGVYSINATTDENVVDFDSIKESAYEPGMDAAYAIMAENEANYNNILKAIGITEYNTLESTGAEMIYEAADVKGFFGKIKAFFKLILEKITGLFKRFVLMVNQYTMKDKEFVKKYAQQINSVKTSNLKEIEFEGYEFTSNVTGWVPDTEANITEMGTTYTAIKDAISAKNADYFKKDNTNVDDFDFEEFEGKTRAKVLGESGTVDEDEFADKLKEFFYGSTDKVDIEITDGKKYLDIISTSEANKTIAQKAYTKFSDQINKLIKAYDDFEKKAATIDVIGKDGKVDDVASKKWSKVMKLSNLYSRQKKTILNFSNTVYSMQLKAMKDRNSQARAICVKILTYKPKKESAGFEHYTESGSFLDSVVLK